MLFGAVTFITAPFAQILCIKLTKSHGLCLALWPNFRIQKFLPADRIADYPNQGLEF